MNRIDIAAANVKSALINILAAYPELADDEQLALDNFEGETNLFEIISLILKNKSESDFFVSGIKEHINSLSARKARYEKNSEGYRKLILELMNIAKLDKIPLPEATIFRTKGRETIIVKDVSELPQGYYNIERTADIKAIKDCINSGGEVAGAFIEIGQPSLTIRIK